MDCIQSIENQEAKEELGGYEVFIVNNYPKDQKELDEKLSYKDSVILTLKREPGLSKARNHGIQLAKGKWIAFIDDDAILPQGFIGRALDIIKEDRFDCFGGGIASWWRYGQPRWLDESFGSKPQLLNHRGELSKEQYNWGSNIFIKQAPLKAVGGFPEDIGMKGSKIGYAAENIVQIELRKKGYIIGFDPTLSLNHLVNANKLKLSWHIKATYATARDGKRVYPEDYTLKGYFKTIKRIITAPIKGIFKMFQTHYYWENYLLEIVNPWAQLSGKIRAKKTRR